MGGKNILKQAGSSSCSAVMDKNILPNVLIDILVFDMPSASIGSYKLYEWALQLLQ